MKRLCLHVHLGINDVQGYNPVPHPAPGIWVNDLVANIPVSSLHQCRVGNKPASYISARQGTVSVAQPHEPHVFPRALEAQDWEKTGYPAFGIPQYAPR